MRKRWPAPDKVIKRPSGFWRAPEIGGEAPDEVVLRCSRPPGFDALSDDEFDALIEKRVLDYEGEIREERDANDVLFRCDVTDKRPSPHSFPRTRAKLFGLMPLIGAADKDKRIAAIQRLTLFRHLHKAARLARKAVDFAVVFPYGTNQAVRRWNVPVESAPT